MTTATPDPALASRETSPAPAGMGLDTELPGYRLERVIARGGMGVVYEATQLELNRRVAVKLLAPERALDRGLRARFRREALLQASLDHPHVLKVYEARTCDAGLFIVMPLIRGETLRSRLRRGPLEPAAALELLAPVADALDAAHARGLVHRDVKPENVLVARGHAYLADFGLVRALGCDALTRPGVTVGTLGYVAPEQFRGAEPSPSGDIYAFAAVLREAVAPGVFADALARGLAYDPADRPASASELVALARAELRSGPADERRRRLRVRRRHAVACLLAVASGAWGLMHQGSSPFGARVASLMVAEMTGAEWARDRSTPALDVPADAPGVAIVANVSVQGPRRPLRVVCDLRDLDTGATARAVRIVAAGATTIAIGCWVQRKLLRSHRYQATLWLWVPEEPEPIAVSTRSVGRA